MAAWRRGSYTVSLLVLSVVYYTKPHIRILTHLIERHLEPKLVQQQPEAEAQGTTK